MQCKYGTKVLLLNGKDNAVTVENIKDVANVLRTLQTAIKTAISKKSKHHRNTIFKGDFMVS